jgi:hypothetical protein
MGVATGGNYGGRGDIVLGAAGEGGDSDTMNSSVGSKCPAKCWTTKGGICTAENEAGRVAKQ